MQKDIKTLEENGTWILVNLPKCKRDIYLK